MLVQRVHTGTWSVWSYSPAISPLMLKSSFNCCRTSKHQLFPWRKHKVTMQSYFAIFPHLEPASFSSCHLRWIKNSLLSHAIPSLCTESQTGKMQSSLLCLCSRYSASEELKNYRSIYKNISLSQKTATTAICCSSLTLNLNNPLQPHWT